MTNNGTSPKELSRLSALGIPLDGEVVEGIRVASTGLSIHPIVTRAESKMFDQVGGGTGVMIHFAIANDSDRLIRVEEYKIEIPWSDPDFALLEDPRRKGSRADGYSFGRWFYPYNRELVLNHRTGRQGVIRSGPDQWLKGFLLAEGPYPIPEDYPHHEWTEVQLVIFDNRGNRYEVGVEVFVDRGEQLRNQRELEESWNKKRVRPRLFEAMRI